MLFHVSGDITDAKTKLFVPRIPEHRYVGEDDTIPRICFSDSILGCIKAIPDSYDGIYNRLCLQEERGIPALFSVYSIDEGRLPKDIIRTPEQLQHLVPDALQTSEYWILNFTLELPLYSYIWVKNIQLDEDDNIIDCQFEHSKSPYQRCFSLFFIYESEFMEMKKMIECKSLTIEEEKVIPVSLKGCAFTHVYALKFSVPKKIDIGDIWATYYIIRACYDDELFEEEFKVLKSIEESAFK
jgi:hypothetical protein